MKTAGFSLITMSIILTVAALVFVSLLPGKDAGDINAKMINNERKLEKVEEAMRSFMTLNGRRPCPADGVSAPGTPTFGTEVGAPGGCAGAPLGPDAHTGYIVGGTIPTRALGLDDSYAFDDWGRRFTYDVDIRATGSASCLNLEQVSISNSTPGGTGDLQIESTNGATPPLDQVMYAYISHGASGYGAFPAQGASTPAGRINSGSTDTDMQVNAGVDAPGGAAGAPSTFTYSTTNFTNVKIQKSRIPSNLPSGGTDTGFDDFLWYRPDLRNTCCLGILCVRSGFEINQLSGGGGGGGGGANGWDNVATGYIAKSGYKDIVIGGVKQSSVYVVFGGSNSTLQNESPLLLGNCNGTNCIHIKPPSYSNINIGTNIAVGDINGDGYDDIVISSYTNSLPVIWVVLGQPASFWQQNGGTYTLDATPGTGLIDGVHGFGIYDDVGQAADNIGGTPYPNIAVADINNDTYKDIIIGAPGATPVSGVANAGKVYVIYGKSGTAAAWPTLPPPPAPAPTVTVNGSTVATVSSTAGLAVGEYIVSASLVPAINQIEGINPSTSQIILASAASGSGAAYTTTSALSTYLDGVQGFELDGVSDTVNGTASSTGLGNTVSAGDVNGDGLQDIVATNNGQDAHGITAAGSVYTVFGGKTLPLPAPISAPTINSITPGLPSVTVSSAAGLVVGQNVYSATNIVPLVTAVTTVSGSKSATVTSYTGLMVGQEIWVYGAAGGLIFPAGTTISSCDVTNNTTLWTPCASTTLKLSNKAASTQSSLPLTVYPTIVSCGSGTTIGTTCSSTTLTLAVDALPAASGGTLNVSSTPITALGTNGLELYGGSGQKFNQASLGDVNNDGKADILISSSGGTNLKVVYGQSNWSGSINTTDSWFNGLNGFEITGSGIYSVNNATAAVADVNGDGYPDIILGNPNNNSSTGLSGAGNAFVLFGSGGGWPSSGSPASLTINSGYVNGTDAVEFDGPAKNAYAGASVATGDINKDGYPDIIIGSGIDCTTDGVTPSGCAWSIWGKKQGILWSNSPVTSLSTIH